MTSKLKKKKTACDEIDDDNERNINVKKQRKMNDRCGDDTFAGGGNSGESSNISILPHEMLLHVFQHLNLKELCRAAR